MALSMRSSRNDYDLTDGARYLLWAEKHGIDIKAAPAEFTTKRMSGEVCKWFVIDWGRVVINDQPSTQFYVVYKNYHGQRFTMALYKLPDSPLPSRAIRVWVE